MRKVKKIMDIHNHNVATIEGTPISISICNIKHTPVHFHDTFLEMIFCLEGCVNVLCNHETITLHKGEIFTVGFDDLHCIYSDKDNITVLFYIDMENIDVPWDTIRSSYFACEDTNLEPYQIKPMREIKDFILASVLLYTQDRLVDKNSISKKCKRIAGLLMKYFDWNNKVNLTPDINDDLRQRLRMAMDYCAQNYMDKITISQLADKLHINGNYLSQFMHKSGYGGFNNMVGYVRCFYAQFHLLTGKMSIVEISNKCGFSDVKYFYKYFKSIWRKSPTEFRNWFARYIQEEDSVYYYKRDEIMSKIEPFIAEYFTKCVFTA